MNCQTQNSISVIKSLGLVQSQEVEGSTRAWGSFSTNLILVQFSLELSGSVIKLLIFLIFHLDGSFGLSQVVSNALAFSVIFTTWEVRKLLRIKDWLILLLLTKVGVIAERTSDSQVVGSSVKKHLDWSLF